MKFYPCARADNFQRSVRIPEQIWTIWCILRFYEFRICCFQLWLLRRAFATGDRRDTDEDDVDSPKSQDFRRVFVVANLLQTAPNCHIIIFQGHSWLLFASTKVNKSISGMWLTKLPPSNVLEGSEHWKGFRGTQLDKDDELPFWEESDFVEDWLNAEWISSMFFSMFHVADPKGKTFRKRTGPWLAPFRGTDMGRRFSAGLHGPTHVTCAMSCHDQSLHTVAGVGFCHGLLNRHNLGLHLQFCCFRHFQFHFPHPSHVELNFWLHLHVFGSQPYIV